MEAQITDCKCPQIMVPKYDNTRTLMANFMTTVPVTNIRDQISTDLTNKERNRL